MRRFVVPAGDSPSSLAPWGRTWAEVAEDNGVELAVLGDAWCLANNVTEVGMADELAADVPPPVVPASPLLTLLDALASARTLDDVAEAAAAAIAAGVA